MDKLNQAQSNNVKNNKTNCKSGPIDSLDNRNNLNFDKIKKNYKTINNESLDQGESKDNKIKFLNRTDQQFWNKQEKSEIYPQLRKNHKEKSYSFDVTNQISKYKDIKKENFNRYNFQIMSQEKNNKSITDSPDPNLSQKEKKNRMTNAFLNNSQKNQSLYLQNSLLKQGPVEDQHDDNQAKAENIDMNGLFYNERFNHYIKENKFKAKAVLDEDVNTNLLPNKPYENNRNLKYQDIDITKFYEEQTQPRNHLKIDPNSSYKSKDKKNHSNSPNNRQTINSKTKISEHNSSNHIENKEIDNEKILKVNSSNALYGSNCIKEKQEYIKNMCDNEIEEQQSNNHKNPEFRNNDLLKNVKHSIDKNLIKLYEQTIKPKVYSAILKKDITFEYDEAKIYKGQKVNIVFVDLKNSADLQNIMYNTKECINTKSYSQCYLKMQDNYYPITLDNIEIDQTI